MEEVLSSFIRNKEKRALQKTYHQIILNKYSWSDMAEKTKKLYNKNKI